MSSIIYAKIAIRFYYIWIIYSFNTAPRKSKANGCFYIDSVYPTKSAIFEFIRSELSYLSKFFKFIEGLNKSI